jgi:hypothetical protein
MPQTIRLIETLSPNCGSPQESDPVAPQVQALSSSPVSGVVPSSIAHRQDPRDGVVVLECLTLLPHAIAQLNALGDGHVLALRIGLSVVENLDQTVEACGGGQLERLNLELRTRAEPRADVAFDPDGDGVG